MEKKVAPPPTAAAVPPPRHRFNDSSEHTTIMPLADILRRSAQEGVAGQSTSESPFAESTKLSLNPFLDLKTGSIKIPGQAVVPAAPAAPPSKAAAPGSTPPGSRAGPPATKPAGAGKPAENVASQVTVFFSCKGGAGATALSCNVAHGYSRRSLKTCLMDLDLQLGDTLAALSLQPRTTLSRAIEMVTKGEALTSAALPQHRTGVAVLSQVGSLEDLDKINPEGLGTLIDKMRGPFDRILIDGVGDFSDNVLAVLDKADKIVLIILQEVLAIRRGRWAFGILKKIGFESDDITVVVNRYSPQHQISLKTLGSMFEGSKILPVARDEGMVLQSLDLGTSLHDINPRHPLTKNVADIGAHLLGEKIVESGATQTAGVPVKGLGDRFKFWRKT